MSTDAPYDPAKASLPAQSFGMREEQLGRHTAGIWTAAQARLAGLSDDEVYGRLHRGDWQSPHRGVYADAGVQLSPLMRGWAAVSASGGPGRAWATGRTTLRMFQLPLIDDDDPATGAHDLVHDDVLVRGRHRNRATLHPTRQQVSDDQLGNFATCPSVSLPAALVHATSVLSAESLVCVLDAALHRALLSSADLHKLAAGQAGRRGAGTLRTAAAVADGRAESPLETLGRLALRDLLPGLVPQVRVRDRFGRELARVDLGDEALRLAVEGDGRATHQGMAAEDHRRDRTIGREDWHTERYTWFEVRRQRAAMQRRMVAAAGALRRQQAA